MAELAQTALGFLGRRWILQPAASGGGGAGLRPAGADAGQGGESG
jgi:hypothetical protein